MSDLEQLAEVVKRSFPTAELKMTLPERAGQAGWLDISSAERSIAIEWRPGIGFGVSLLPDMEMEEDPASGLFEGPDQVFEGRADAEKHVLGLLHAAARPQIRLGRTAAR